MKHLKLFFALFAMLALGVGNAWGAEYTKVTATNTLSNGDLVIIAMEDAGIPATGVSGGIVQNSTTTKKDATVSTIESDWMIFTVTTTTDGWYLSNNSSQFIGKPGANTFYLTTSESAKGICSVNNDGVLKCNNRFLCKNNTNYRMYSSVGSYVPFYVYKVVAGGGETPKPVTISLNKTELNLQEGATETLTATVTGSTESVTWTSSKTAVATIDNTGKVTAVAAGEATITAAIGDVTATCVVSVTAASTPGTGSEGTLVITRSCFPSGTLAYNTTDIWSATASTGETVSGQGDLYSTANQTTMQTKNSNVSTHYHNTTAMPGAIKKISMEMASGTNRSYTVYASTSQISSTTGLTSIGTVKSGTPIEIDPVKGYKYFWLQCTGGASYLNNITIVYEASGSSSTETVLSVEPNKVDFGTKNIYFDSEKKGSLEIEITGQNLTGAVAAELSGTDDASVFTLSASSFTPNAGEVSEKLTVSYEVSEARDYTATLTLSSDGVEAIELPITLKVINEEPATYVKVTNAVTDGEYLIVYEEGNVAFNGSLTTLDAVSNTVAIEINNNIIVGNTEIDAATFTISAMTEGYAIKSKSGKYIGRTSSSNGMNTGDSEIQNVITFPDGAVKIAGSGSGSTTSLQYNATSGQTRFRYFGTEQKPIALYKKASKHIVTIADCTNGSVSAKMGETALVNNDQVLSGTQITLGNDAATNYKLSAYDVYKTDDATTKVTVADDNTFIMPEFDVTISATFELAKTLTGIEITNAATQTTFWQGETFNHDGLKVTAHFDGAADEDVTDKVTVNGSTTTAGTQTVTVSYAEGTTTKTTTYTINVKAIPNTKETAYTVADAYDIIDKLGDTDKMYITGFVSQADLEQSSIDQYKNADYWISADGTTNGQQLEAFRGKYLDNTDFTSVDQIMRGDEVIIYGKLTKYGSTYEFAAGNYLVSLKRDKQQPELSYTTTEYEVNLGDVFTAPTLNNPHSLAVTYSSNDEDVATVAVDGAVTIKAAGTVTITASFAGDENYVAGEASYNITITDPSISEATFVAGTDKSDTKSISKKGITVTFTDGTFSRDDNYRCYAGKEMTISYDDGNITKIVFTCDGSNYGPDKFSTETVTYSSSGSVGTWVGDAKSVTFAASSQVRMKDITVYYKQDKRTETGLAWNPATVSLTVGDAFTAPTLSNPNNLTGITFASDNEALATVTNAGVISLVNGKTGTATITATYAGNETYKAAEVTCVITVSPKSEKVVILAQLEGQWYAMTGAYVTDKTNVLAAIPVEYINGKLYNVAETDKASIEWQRSMNGNKATFKNGDNYLTGGTSGTDLTLKTIEFEWDYNGVNYLSGNETTKRTFLYCENTKNNVYGFKNFAISNAGSVKNNSDGTTESYSSTPEVVAPVYATATIYTREDLTVDNHGTICLPYGSSNYSGAEFYEVSSLEVDKGLWLDQLAAGASLEAGKPYIFKATAAKIAVAYEGAKQESPVAGVNGLTGTFTDIEANDVLVGNYIIAENQIWVAGEGATLPANRAYINATLVPKKIQPEIPGRRRVCMGENAATGFDNIVAPEGQAVKVIENGQLIIIRDGVKYNVQGQKL